MFNEAFGTFQFEWWMKVVLMLRFVLCCLDRSDCSLWGMFRVLVYRFEFPFNRKDCDAHRVDMSAEFHQLWSYSYLFFLNGGWFPLFYWIHSFQTIFLSNFIHGIRTIYSVGRRTTKKKLVQNIYSLIILGEQCLNRIINLVARLYRQPFSSHHIIGSSTYRDSSTTPREIAKKKRWQKKRIAWLAKLKNRVRTIEPNIYWKKCKKAGIMTEKKATRGFAKHECFLGFFFFVSSRIEIATGIATIPFTWLVSCLRSVLFWALDGSMATAKSVVFRSGHFF